MYNARKLPCFNRCIALWFTLLFTACGGAVNMTQAAEATPVQSFKKDSGNTGKSNRDYYIFGVFPYLSPRNIGISYGPISEEFSQILHNEVRLRSASSFEKFTEKLDKQYYDIAVIQPFDYVQAVEYSHYVPLARLNEPLVTMFVVKNASPLKNLQDLRGKRVAFPPKPAANSRMGLKSLVDAGLTPGRNVFIQYYSSHGSCMHEMLIDEVSACVTAAPIVKMFNERMNAHVRALAKTEAIPHILFVAHERVPAQQRRELQNLITSWQSTKHGRNLLHHLGFPGFVVAKPSDYKVMYKYSDNRSTRGPKNVSNRERKKGELILGVFPYLPPKRLAETFAPLPVVFTDIIGNSVTFRTTSSYEKFTENLENHAYDIAMVQPFDYELAIKNGYVPFVQKKSKIAAGFFVQQNSRIKSLRDLKGTTIAMPPFNAALTRLALRELRLRGLTPGKDVEIQYRPTLDSCMFQLRHNLVTSCAAWAEMKTLVGANEMRGIKLLLKTDTIPGPMFVAKRTMPESIRTMLAKEMISWENTPSGKKLLKTLRIGPFEPFSAANYEALIQKRQEFQ